MLTEIFNFTTNMRIHWVYLLSAAVISAFYLKKLKIFSFHYFFNNSSKLDFQLFVTNRVVKFFFILPIEGTIIYSLCKWFLKTYGSGSFNLSFSSSLSIAAYTLFLFVIDDFLRFIQHYLMHKVPFLWEIHKVHHSAHVLTPMTLYRVHLLEVFISSFRRILGTVFLTCIMFVLTHKVLSPIQIMGALSLNFIFNILGGNLRHSHIPLSFGFLERIFISPAQHQIHHSKALEHFDKNFGVALSIWDQIFSTWISGKTKTKINVGLSYYERNHKNNIVSCLIDPIKSNLSSMKKNYSSQTIIKSQGELI